MPSVNDAVKQTDNKFLNIFELDAVRRDGTHFPYQVASRAREVSDLKAISGKNNADAVAIFGVCDVDNRAAVVLVRQYRYPVGGYIYELPAGLIDAGESAVDAAKREMVEETGMEFTPTEDAKSYRPFFSSPGMTDESVVVIHGLCCGTPTNINQEKSEDIQVVLADYDECIRILNEENVDMRTGVMLKLFIALGGR